MKRLFMVWRTYCVASCCRCLLIPVAGLMAASPGLAAETELELAPIEITATGVIRNRGEAPMAVTVVDESALQDGREGVGLDEGLKGVPGVFFQNRYNFAQDLRISIRGFGARAPFGIRGIRLRVDGIPETLPDGQSQIDTIDLETMERVEVLRGPSSALYGNAAGGMLAVTTPDGRDGAPPRVSVTGGSHGLRRTAASGGGMTGAWNGHLSAWHMDYDGYRDQSRTEKMMLNGKAGYQLGPGRRLETVFTAYDQPTGEDPGGLTRAEVREDRRQADTEAESLDAGQSVTQQRLGLIYRDVRSLPGELALTTFYTRRDFEQQLPFAPGPSLIGYERDFYGTSAEYRDQARVADLPLDWTMGVSFREQRDDRERFNVNGNGERGTKARDALEQATSTAVYGQVDLAVTDSVRMMLGGRYDHVRFRVDEPSSDDRVLDDRSYDEFSVSLGPTWSFHPRHQLYANFGTAFETPTFTELVDATANDNPTTAELQPQEAFNTEVGLKGIVSEWVRYELAAYRVTTEDEIVVNESDGGSTTYRNAGETRRDGIELGAEAFATENLTLTGAYTWSDFRFRDRSGGLRGNRLPGLPEHNLFLEAAWEEGPWMAALETEAVSDVYANDANTASASGYALVHLRGQYELAGGSSRLTLGGGIQNLFDRDYFSNVRVNASGGAFYEPAPGRTIHASVSLTF